MHDPTKMDYSKLLGFDMVADDVADGVNFRDATIGAKLGAKVGKTFTTYMANDATYRSSVGNFACRRANYAGLGRKEGFQHLRLRVRLWPVPLPNGCND